MTNWEMVILQYEHSVHTDMVPVFVKNWRQKSCILKLKQPKFTSFNPV